MIMTMLPHKIVHHIPQQAWVDGNLTDIDTAESIKLLLADFAKVGITSFYSAQATGYYKGRSYPEQLFTIFGDLKTVSMATDVFSMWNIKNRNVLQQEAYAYEIDGKLYSYKIS